MNMIGITLTESSEGPDRLNRAYSVDNTGKHEKLSEGPVNDCKSSVWLSLSVLRVHSSLKQQRFSPSSQKILDDSLSELLYRFHDRS